MRTFLARWLLCLIGHHHWTSAIKENCGQIPEEFAVSPNDDSDEINRKFWLCARMYCSRCRKMWEGNIQP